MLNRILIFLISITFIFGGLLIPFNADASEIVTAGEQLEILTLEKCIELASENSKDLQLASKQVAQKKESLKQSRAGFLPTLKYGYLASETDDASSTLERNEANLSLEQPLYTGGKLTAGLRIAKLEYEKALEDERSAKQQVIFGVKQCYYIIWLAEQTLKVTQDSYDYMGRLYQQTKRLYDVGTKSKYDLLMAQTEFEKRKPDLIEAKNGVIMAKLQLANLIGLPQNKAFNVKDELSQVQLPESMALSLESILEEAYQMNPEIRNAQKDLAMAKNSIKIARAGYLPTIGVGGTKTKTSNDPASPPLLNEEENTFTIAVNLSGVIFNGFKTQSEVTAAKELEAAAKINESKKRDDIRLNVQKAILDLETSLEKARANKAASNLAKETLRMTQARYDAGMATTMDISEVQIKVDQVLIGYYKGISDYIIALAKLDVTLGRDPQSKE
ncbi:MAG: TolC family protein [Firmicutes bacterium]|nr:TolC family protein [Bacillota bacterium]